LIGKKSMRNKSLKRSKKSIEGVNLEPTFLTSAPFKPEKLIPSSQRQTNFCMGASEAFSSAPQNFFHSFILSLENYLESFR
jgi:hypothetical protein